VGVVRERGEGTSQGGFGSCGGGKMRSRWNGMPSFVKAPDLVRNFARAGRACPGLPSRWGSHIGSMMSGIDSERMGRWCE
jgi:hypothetical protein